MKILPLEFVKRGFLHKQLKRHKNVALYSRQKGSFLHYEVIKVQKHEAYFMMGVEIPAAENFPSCDQWGELGWTMLTLEKAEEKFREISGK